MGNYEHPVYLNELEAEVLFGLLAENSADENGREQHQYWNNIMGQLERILNG
jgi:hypothetical protein